mmetsp:Transcript_72609/g.228740  ORF Transcript_72609/g.228740 Transcript_72609/m.228740 type:complete len:358 (-) Transcript_72609:628-1701(-)
MARTAARRTAGLSCLTAGTSSVSISSLGGSTSEVAAREDGASSKRRDTSARHCTQCAGLPPSASQLRRISATALRTTSASSPGAVCTARAISATAASQEPSPPSPARPRPVAAPWSPSAGSRRSIARTTSADAWRPVPSVMSRQREPSNRSCRAAKRDSEPAATCRATRPMKSATVGGRALSSASIFSAATAASTAAVAPLPLAAASPRALAAALRDSHSTRQKIAASGSRVSPLAAPPGRPPPPSARDMASLVGLMQPAATRACRACSATASLVSTSRILRRASGLSLHLCSQTLRTSTAAALTAGERSPSPARRTRERCAMERLFTGTLVASTMYATLRTSSDTSLVRSTTAEIV